MTRLNPVRTFALLLLLCGCFEVEQEYTLNPDGSGKVRHSVKAPDMMGQGEALLGTIVRDQLRDAKGVDAWSDVSVRVTDEGSLQFVGTAYFSDFNALSLKGADGPSFRLEKRPGGALAMMIAPKVSEGSTGEPVAPPSGDRDIEKEIGDAKREWNQMKTMARALFSSLKWTTTFHLPGPIETSEAFEKLDSDSVRMRLSGEQIFETFAKIFEDEALLRKLAETGSLEKSSEPGDMPPEVVAMLLGGEKASVVTTRRVKPQFEYGSAVAKAKAGEEAMLASLPISAAAKRSLGPAPPPARGGDFRRIATVSVSYVHDEAEWDEPGATIRLIGELPGSVLAVNGGNVTKVTASNGTDLLPEDTEIDEIRLGDGNAMVRFSVPAKLPPAGSNGFSEVSGILRYSAASSPAAMIDLGFSRFAEGESGKVHDAKIVELEPGMDGESFQVSIEVGVDRHAVEEFEFTTPSGETIEAMRLGVSWSGSSSVHMFEFDRKPPENLRVSAKIIGDLRDYEIPFTVRNVDLIGRSASR